MALVTGYQSAGLTGLVRCCMCGQPARGGATDWLGRFRCEDCARAWDGVLLARRRQEATDQEAARLSMVATEVGERAAMWGLDPR